MVAFRLAITDCDLSFIGLEPVDKLHTAWNYNGLKYYDSDKFPQRINKCRYSMCTVISFLRDNVLYTSSSFIIKKYPLLYFSTNLSLDLGLTNTDVKTITSIQ